MIQSQSVKLFIIISAFFLALSPPAAGQIYVDPDAPGINDGSSWKNAYLTLTDALDTAQYGDEIRLAEGIYKPNPTGLTDPRQATFQLSSGLTLTGGYAGYGQPDPNERKIDIYKSILTGDLAGNDNGFASNDENCYHVVDGSSDDPNTVIDGFTITAGNAHDSFPYDRGGGIYYHYGPIIDCIFTGNTADYGAGISWSHGPITGCTFSNNKADLYGGGIYAGYGPVKNCTFSANIADLGGGILYSYGLVTDSAFTNNKATYGGGIHTSYETVANSIFAGNSAHQQGGGIYRCYGIVTTSTFTGNRAADVGGGIYRTYHQITNCIFWANIDDADGNSGGPFTGETAQVNVADPGAINYCCLQGWTGAYGGLGSIANDPNFAQTGYWNAGGTPTNIADDSWIEGDYHLRSQAGRWHQLSQSWVYDDVTSRALDAGNPGSPLADEPLHVNNLRINMGAYGATAQASKTPSGWSLLADLDNDGNVNLADYAHQTTHWLKNENELPGDLNRNGSVNISDLYLLFLDWLKSTSWASNF